MTQPLDDLVRDWVTDNVGEVVSFERQQRWRPAWFVVADREGRAVRLYVRGNRDGFGTMDVGREAAILRVMEAHSIPVPHVHAEIGGGAAVVMDWLTGEPNLGTAADDRQVDAVMDSYVEALAAVHRIEPTAFGNLGMSIPTKPEAIALDFFDGFVTRYREFKRRPEPLLEFGIGWLRRNIPPDRGEARFVLGDSGQFMFSDRRITGLLDVELAHIGDVAHDLAGLRLRNATEPMGDLTRVLARYEQVSGQPLDPSAIEFHTAKFALCTPLGLVIALHLDLALPEILQYVEWFHQLSLHAIESIARLADVRLETVSLPDPAGHEYTGLVNGLPAMIAGLDAAAGIAEYRRDTVASVARFAARVNEYEPAIISADLDDIGTLIGQRPVDRLTGDTLLEDFIGNAGPEYDATLIRLLHRRCMRQMLLLEPVLSAPDGIGHLAPLT
ncbi:phosphotransferase family protein [Mycolicibacterium sp.]|uniref:phosphotransferase family protein n=1 Tax=Mycolicibacterium sp. TaxID=2320850 RepID=UPI0037C95FDC